MAMGFLVVTGGELSQVPGRNILEKINTDNVLVSNIRHLERPRESSEALAGVLEIVVSNVTSKFMA